MQLESTIRSYIESLVHMSLATSKDDIPWITEVHFVYDDALNFYFRSLESRRHSVEIEKNPKVAGNCIGQHEKGDPVSGVYFEGKCQKIDTPDDSIIGLFEQRLGADPEVISEESKQDGGHKFYKIEVDDFYFFDAHTLPSTKHHLSWSNS